MNTILKRTLLALSLVGALVTLGGCAHERFHHDFGSAHRGFHAQPHARGEHHTYMGRGPQPGIFVRITRC